MKLQDLYKTLTGEEREALAKKAGINPGYLWQLASQWRGKKPSLDVIVRLAAADPRLHSSDLIAEFAPKVEAA